MSFSVQIVKDDIRPYLSRLAGDINGPQVKAVMARAGVNTLRAHFVRLNGERANRLGGRRTNFYANAARGTQSRVESDAIVLSVNAVGIRQRLLGGRIVPKASKALTIPVHPRAYAKRAREFSDLVLVSTKRGTAFLMRRPGRGRRFGEVYFILVKAVDQRPDPSVLPSDDELLEPMAKAGSDYLSRRSQ